MTTEENNKEKELKSHTVALMICVAIFFDVLQGLLAYIFMDWLVSFFAYLTFFVWFKLHGIKLMKPKRFIMSASSLLLEIFPFVASLPALTGMVVFITLDTKAKKIVSKINAVDAKIEKVKGVGTKINKLVGRGKS